jgi:NAD(P)-dependent dehydrogenase (short-subunit alcohol dehydrogenase family)
MIETQFLEEIGEVAVRMAAAANPKGRNAAPEDVIGVIEFLLSPSSGYMTGVDTAITGGSCT